jgi:hypothetical protein
MAARFGTHLWSREFLKARIGPPLSPKFVWNNSKQKKIAGEEDGPLPVRQTVLSLSRISVAAVYHRRTGQRPVFCTMQIGAVCERKSWTISERTNNPKPELELLAVLEQAVA